MKLHRWILALVIAAAALTAVFIVVDKRSQEKERKSKIGGPKQLFSVDASTVERITIDNEEGTFSFLWNEDAHQWVLDSEEQYELDTNAVSAICTQFCSLRSEKTVAFDCQDTAPFGFDDPVTIRLYTTETGDSNPYLLYVGSNTPTYDSYYAMTEASDDVYTINYTAGSIFCVAKDTLKTKFLFDTYGSQVSYYRCETDGILPTEIRRAEDGSWTMTKPAQLTVFKANADNLMETVVRVTLESYVEENPADLAKYGLDKPWSKLWLKGNHDGRPMEEEVWFGSEVTENADEASLYGYFVKNKQVFTIGRAMCSFIRNTPNDLILPYCFNVNIEELNSVEIDMGSVYNMKETLSLDYENSKYALSGREISEDNSDLLEKFQNYYRTISNLAFSDLALDAEPEGEPEITIVYHLRKGLPVTLGFVPLESNNYALMKNGAYTGQTVRLNRFTASGSIVPAYEELKKALN